LVFGGAILVLIVFTARELPYVLSSAVAGALAISALWIVATNRRFRWWAAVAAVTFLAVAVASIVAVGRGAVAVLIGVAGILVAAALGTLALRWEVRQALALRWQPAPPTRRGVVFMNPRSGDGKVAKLHLVDEALRRGIEPVLMNPGDDLRALAELAAARGADALGMAGGDGSQAVVASVAAAHGLPFVCIPVGTRNHFALDLGINRDDPAGALDAFNDARETTIDLGELNGEVFVNNVSLGLYAHIVSSAQYREAKRRTVAEMLPGLMGSNAQPSGLSLDGPDGVISGAQLIEISNNPYLLSSLTGFGSRARLNTGSLGVVALSIKRSSDVNKLVALEAAGHPERYPGWREWTASELQVRGPSELLVAADGEARTMSSPLRCVLRPGALRVRISKGQSGASPAFLRAPVAASTWVGLARVARGRPSGIVAK
jgi:diacylglycerol kinase family enzyme